MQPHPRAGQAVPAEPDGRVPDSAGSLAPAVDKWLVRSGTRSQLLVTVVLTAVLAGVVVWQWETVAAGVGSLAGADVWWLGVAAVGAVAMWPTSVWMLRGSMPVDPPTHHLFAVQWAVTAVSVIPAAPLLLRLRFLRRAGLGHVAAWSSIGLLGFAVIAVRAPLALIAFAATPGLLDRTGTRVPGERVTGWLTAARAAITENPWRSVAIAVPVGLMMLALLVGAAVVARRYARARGGWRELGRRWVRRHLHRASTDLPWKSVVATAFRPHRAGLLWTSAAVQPFLNIATLWAVLHAVDVDLSLAHAYVVYLLTITLAPLIPTPNGVASKEIAMVTGLTAIAGVTAGIAVGAALGFRLLTFWGQIPLGVLSVTYLSRRRVI
ncbi:YbhN family protein [Nocardia sp. NPDC127526]|uniref:lysylphosphatidylglycerol synthase transmembrane domain-containing protein n=1 Tax=Nocardia sp. NPDC127526 TaxID=3345393 RepID=UPI00363D141E